MLGDVVQHHLSVQGRDASRRCVSSLRTVDRALYGAKGRRAGTARLTTCPVVYKPLEAH